jgi:hypothetical protein
LFIPGSYHTVIALLACLKYDGYKYDDVSAFETDEWHNDDD